MNGNTSVSTRRFAGYTTVELVVTLAAMMIISAIAMPSITRSVRIYQLNQAADQLAGILKFTRFEAIRRNSPINCVNAQAGVDRPANVWSDNNGDGVAQPTEKQIVLGTNNTLVPASAVPDTRDLAAAVGAPELTAVNPAAGSVRFDQRGAVVPAATVYVFYVGNAAAPENGFRAVVILPSGSVQVWSYPAGIPGGPWHLVS